MNGPRRLGRRLPAAAFVLLAVLSGLAPAAATAVGSSDQPDSGSGPSAPSMARVQAQIKSLKGNTALKADVRKQALSLYQQALSDLQSAKQYAQSAQAYSKALKQAPSQTQALQQQEYKSGSIDQAALQKLPLAKLENQLSQARAHLSAARAKLSSLDQRISQVSVQPSSTREALNRLKEETAAQQVQPKPDDPAVIVDAKQTLQRAEQYVHAQHIDMLQQELLSHDARLNLLQAKQTKLQKKVKAASNRVSVLQQIDHQRRTAEAQHLAQATEQTEQQTQNQPDPLPSLAQDNAKLAQQIASLAPQIVQAGSARDQIHHKSKNLRQDYKDTKTQLAIAGLGHELGDVLRRQREALPSLSHLRSDMHHRKTRIAQARLDQYRIEEQQAQLSKLKQNAQQRLAQQKALSPPQQTQAQNQLEKLLSQRGLLLQRLNAAYTQYINELVSLEHEQGQLLSVAQSFSMLLDENLIWTASARPAGLGWLNDIARSVDWLITPSNWGSTIKALWQGFRQTPWLAAIIAGLLLGLGLTHRRLRKILNSRAAHIGNVTRDRFLFTVEGMGVTVLLALPAALTLALPGVLITEGAGSQYFPVGAGHGLINAAILILFFESFRQFCRDGGVADKHFRWPEESRNVLMRNFWWLLMIVLPITLLVSLTNQAPDIYRNGIGRLAFVVASLALSVFFWRVLHPHRGAISMIMERRNGTWQRILRLVVYPAAVAIPTGIAILALSGYYFTALTLESRVYSSAWLFVGIVIGVGLTLRWLNVAGRRLALARARAKREAALAERASKEAAEASGEGLPENLDMPEIDLDTINDQTRKLMGLFVVLALVIGLWLIWHDMLPALNVLNHVTLWSASIGSGTNKTLAHITLQDLFLASAVVAFTVAAARNLPGLLEISVLQRFEVDAGNRYAITTVSRYLISGVGLLIALKLIGIGWKQAQWLVAALGVGLGFGLQEIFANFISGLIILFERPIRIGDTVTVAGTSGTVSRIRIRATTITDWDRKELIVPNKTFITSQVTNWTLSNSVQRIVIPIGIDYASDPDQATDIMLETVKKHPMTLEDPPPAVLFMGYGESTLDFQVRAFVHDLDTWLPLMHELNINLYRALREANINIAFPQRDLHIRSWDAQTPWEQRERQQSQDRQGEHKSDESSEPRED